MTEPEKAETPNVFGIVPSRRLGQSLGVSPIPNKACNYSCVYCQLGRTHHYVRQRQTFYDVDDIIKQLKQYLEQIQPNQYDIITIVGDGEPTLYSELGTLIQRIKALQSKPVAVISNGALLFERDVREEVAQADVVMLNFDSWDQESLRRINRPLSRLTFERRIEGYRQFRKIFTGMLYLEVMLVKGLNDSDEALMAIADLARDLQPDRIFVNTPVRPPAEQWVEIPDEERVARAKEILAANRIDYLPEGDFVSLRENPVRAVLDIISRHPMRIEDIRTLLLKREGTLDTEQTLKEIVQELESNPSVTEIKYGSATFYRISVR
ncbi:MAG: radical SAM protein [Candidatus Thorarchaeota archaeon]|nr:radical SAM protein [Candidatus Thorarchaeota archaeon]